MMVSRYIKRNIVINDYTGRIIVYSSRGRVDKAGADDYSIWFKEDTYYDGK